MRRDCHALLKGEIRGESKHRHGFPAAEMESLASICEVVLLALPLETLNRTVEQPGKAMQTFWTTSASQYPIPHELAEILVKRGLIEAVILVRVVLLLLSTRLGTLLLCGFLCVSQKWPFINKFSSITLENREKIMQKWLKDIWLFTPIRLAFAYIKVLCLFVFFSWAVSVLVVCFSMFLYI